jgi:hypothetical protein
MQLDIDLEFWSAATIEADLRALCGSAVNPSSLLTRLLRIRVIVPPPVGRDGLGST